MSRFELIFVVKKWENVEKMWKNVKIVEILVYFLVFSPLGVF